KQLGDMLKSTTAESHWSRQLLAIISKGLVWVAGAALPLLIWIGFLYLSYWGIINDMPKAALAAACPPAAVGTATVNRSGPQCGGNIDIKLNLEGCAACPTAAAPATTATPTEDKSKTDPQTSHTPRWLLTTADFVSKLFNNGRVIE